MLVDKWRNPELYSAEYIQYQSNQYYSKFELLSSQCVAVFT